LYGINQYEDLISDLVYLRKDAGFTPRRLREAMTFLEITGSSGDTYEAVKTRLVSAIQGLPSKRDTAVLMMAMALGGDYFNIPLLKHRREHYGDIAGLKPDTIADHESSAINELAIYLLSARYAQSALPSGVPTIHNVAIHECIQVTTLVRDRLWVETREIYRTIPLIDGVEYFEISSDIPAIVTPVSAVVVRSETVSSGLKHRFYFDKPLQRGKLVELSFIMKPDGTRDSELILKEETRAFHLPTMKSYMEVLFLGDKPKLIWHYAGLPVFERPGNPVRERLLDLGNGSSVGVEWNDQFGGLYSGIAWAWALAESSKK